MPPPPGRAKKADRKKAYTDRARARFAEWIASSGIAVESSLAGHVNRDI
jgi:methylenetetrahydrofolate--tRNA-(uracil-5-)-methyltransferase